MIRRPPRSTLFPYTRSSDLNQRERVFERAICISPVILVRPPACSRRRANKNNRRSEEHTSELQSLTNLVCRLLLEKKKLNSRLGTTRHYTDVNTSPACRTPS